MSRNRSCAQLGAERIATKRVQEDEGIRVLIEAARLLSNPSATKRWLARHGRHSPGRLAYGVENLMRNIHKDKPAVHAVMEFATELCFDYLELSLTPAFR